MRKRGAGGNDFAEARRVVAGATAGLERRALSWLAPRVPAAITSDHLTALGFAATFACGVLYAASGRRPWLLLGVNAALAVHWLGDSLDGTLARHRHSERPRFGFYVDHLADAFGALFVLAGLGISGLMSPMVAALVLVGYFLLAIETYLATYTLGQFKISWGPVGGTELRILLGALNVGIIAFPRIPVLGTTWLVFDVAGAVAAVVLLGITVAAGIRGTRALVREEGWAQPKGGPVGRRPTTADASQARRKGHSFRSSTSSRTAAADLCKAVRSSLVSWTSQTFSTPFEPSCAGTPTKIPSIPNSPSR